MKRVLIVAGSDSSGGAGLEADQKVMAAHGCYAMTATTALTAQNTQGVNGIHEIPSDFVRQQMDACVEDIGLDAIKTGMLASAQTVGVVADFLETNKIATVVVDPVMVATSGAQLLPENAVKTLCDRLLPLTTVLTPNIPEANLILREAGKPPVDINDLSGLRYLAAAVQRLGPKHVLLKGGHCPLDSNHRVARSEDDKKLVVNILAGAEKVDVMEFAYQASRNTHGTGCSLASAITCNLTNGQKLHRAVKTACRYVDAGIRQSVDLGHGSGPINHFHSLQSLQAPPGYFIDYLLERADVSPVWHDYTHHDFVEKMGDGTLPPEKFKYYMIQDYLYLIHFARANALAGYKVKNLDDIASAAAIVTHIRHETNLHIAECEEFGLTEETMKQSEESQACTAYTRYVLDIGQSEDWLALQISLLPCLLGYSIIALRLRARQKTNGLASTNRYLKWINNYTADDYTEAVKKGRAVIEKHVAKQSPSRIEELVKIFIHATKMETGFWDMAST